MARFVWCYRSRFFPGNLTTLPSLASVRRVTEQVSNVPFVNSIGSQTRGEGVARIVESEIREPRVFASMPPVSCANNLFSSSAVMNLSRLGLSFSRRTRLIGFESIVHYQKPSTESSKDKRDRD
jgi:hypothetical protein